MKSKKFKKISKNIYEIKNALPERVAKKILAEFKNHSYKSWKLISQKKPTHYISPALEGPTYPYASLHILRES